MRSALRSIGAAVLCAACGPVLVPADVTFPTYGPLSGGPTAELEARLVRHNSCLALVTQAERYVALWPATYRAAESVGRGIVVVDGADTVLAAEGEAATFGGGEYPAEHRAFVEELVGPLPEDCHGGRYWLVTLVRRAGG